jgi:hypothetical protein
VDPGPVGSTTDEVASRQLGCAFAARLPNRARPMVIYVAAVTPDEVRRAGRTLIAETETPCTPPVVRTIRHALTVGKLRRASNGTPSQSSAARHLGWAAQSCYTTRPRRRPAAGTRHVPCGPLRTVGNHFRAGSVPKSGRQPSEVVTRERRIRVMGWTARCQRVTGTTDRFREQRRNSPSHTWISQTNVRRGCSARCTGSVNFGYRDWRAVGGITTGEREVAAPNAWASRAWRPHVAQEPVARADRS